MGSKKHFVCLACGFIAEGDEPPDECPVCKAPKRAFYARMEMPSAPPLKTVTESVVQPAPGKGGQHWVCLGCGHIHWGNNPPTQCPICKAPQSAFMPRQYFTGGKG
jgi:rubrerythrin